jgi:hypothetical protein
MQPTGLRGRRGRHAGTERAAKARNHSRVAEALPHSEGVAYNRPGREIATCLRVGRMGPISGDGPGQHNPDRSEGPWGKAEEAACMAASYRASCPTQSGMTGRAAGGRERRMPTVRLCGYAGSRLDHKDGREGADGKASLGAVLGKTRRTES